MFVYVCCPIVWPSLGRILPAEYSSQHYTILHTEACHHTTDIEGQNIVRHGQIKTNQKYLILSQNCQHPNLTSTQPQVNPEVGFGMDMALQTPPHTPGALLQILRDNM